MERDRHQRLREVGGCYYHATLLLPTLLKISYVERQDAPPRCLTLLTKGPRVVDVWARAAFDTLVVGGGVKENVLITQYETY